MSLGIEEISLERYPHIRCDLQLAANGEFGTARVAEVRSHLEACWTCRTRMKDLEESIAFFVHAYHGGMQGRLPPPTARARCYELAWWKWRHLNLRRPSAGSFRW